MRIALQHLFRSIPRRLSRRGEYSVFSTLKRLLLNESLKRTPSLPLKCSRLSFSFKRIPFSIPKLITVYCLLLTVSLCAYGAQADFSSYQVIIERAIFGRPPIRAAADPAAAAGAAEQRAAEDLSRKITMCAINRTPSGFTAVGLIDNEAKPPRNFYLNVGDSDSGFTIVAADYDAETAVIRKDDVTITLKLGKGLIGVGAATIAAAEPVAASAKPEAPPPPRPPTSPIVLELTPEERVEREAAIEHALYPSRELPDNTDKSIPDQPVPSNIRQINRMLASGEITDPGYRARLEKRQAELRERIEAQHAVNNLQFQMYASKITREEVERQTRLHNLQLLESGQAPLSPIELTPEEDSHLVEMGVLPAN